MPNSIKIKTIKSDDGQLEANICLEGGKMSSLIYQPYNGKKLSILYQAPWLNDKDIQDSAAIPPVLKRLSGDWVGVPFGGVEQDNKYFYADAPHGLPINNQWRWQAQGTDFVKLSYDYPLEYPLKSLTRHIRLSDNGYINFQLIIKPRSDCHLPVGLHPIFPFGGEMGAVEISIPNFHHGQTYPKQTEPGVSLTKLNQSFNSLDQVPTINGHNIDLSRLPLHCDTEEIIQIIRTNGLVNLHYLQHQVMIALSWDKTLLPDCLLWFSHKGRSAKPWLNRNCCLGVEPICSAWDLGPASTENNIINQFSPTYIAFQADKEVTINYQIHCSQFNKEQQ